MVITRPPEIVVCLSIPVDRWDIFVIFDSHSRPAHPHGAGFIINRGIQQAARYLHSIFPVDVDLMADQSLGWQAQYLANFCGHMLISQDQRQATPDAQLHEVIHETTRTILDLEARLEELKQQNATLSDNNHRLEDEIARAIVRYDRPRAYQAPLPGSYGASSSQGRKPRVGPPSFHAPRPPSITQAQDTSDEPGQRAQSLFSQLLGILPSWNKNPTLSSPGSAIDSSSSSDSDSDDDVAMPATFNCRLCLDDHPEEEVAALQCGHSFCRDGLRKYVVVRLDDMSYPIPCPICIADKGDDPAGT